VRRPPDFRELVGDDLPPEELERLSRADAALRSVPAPPAEVPARLTQSVAALPLQASPWSRRRVLPALALAAALAALFFALGRWTGGDDFEERATVDMQPTRAAPEASGSIQIGQRDDASGNRELRLTVDGLPKLPPGDYYVLWLAKDGEYAGTCGTFAVGEGETTVDMTVSYRLRDFDAWNVSKWDPEGEPPELLRAPIGST
jgi:Anti-sigma-K factor rskA